MYKSQQTGKWELGGMAFLKTETEVNVRSAMEFYKDTLTYTTDEKTIFFVDKDFTYIREVEASVPWCYHFTMQHSHIKILRTECSEPKSNLGEGNGDMPSIRGKKGKSSHTSRE